MNIKSTLYMLEDLKSLLDSKYKEQIEIFLETEATTHTLEEIRKFIKEIRDEKGLR